MDITKYIRDVADFPKKGIMFKDISPLLQNPEAFSYCIDKLSEQVKEADVIVGLDARGFLFAGALAYKLQKPLVIIRKKGKLPYETISKDYSFEYASHTFEIHTDAIQKGQRVVIIDDLLATGGTAKAAADLIEELGGVVDSFGFIVDLSFLGGGDILKNYNQYPVVKY